MLIRLVCDCGASARAEVGDPPSSMFRYDKRAIALHAAQRHGWKYVGGRVGKSVVTCLCPECRARPLVLVADFLSQEAVPGTLALDLANEQAGSSEEP